MHIPFRLTSASAEEPVEVKINKYTIRRTKIDAP